MSLRDIPQLHEATERFKAIERKKQRDRAERALVGFMIGTLGVMLIAIFVPSGWYIIGGVFLMMFGNNIQQYKE